MDLVNKKVMHETFGKGSVVNYDDSYININFKSGDKRFSFPDAFKKYVTFVDQKANNLVNEKIEKKEEKMKKKELRVKKERALELKQQYIANQKKRTKGGKVHSKVQSVFWCKPEELEEIFSEWQVFTGEIKSGKKKGQPRRLARMNQNSACLLTKREENMAEEDRQIMGLFMTDESFDGRLCEDGYIKSHPNYRIQLTEEEAEKILFWNYYFDKKSPNKTVWNSGRQRYFDNIWTAQILRDIASLRENPEEKKVAQDFFEHFCRVNFINPDELPAASGSLMRETNN